LPHDADRLAAPPEFDKLIAAVGVIVQLVGAAAATVTVFDAAEQLVPLQAFRV
jgi:hypothetical protein